MPEGNPERGELAIDLDGVPHVLRPSFEAIVAIERQTGKSLEQLAGLAGADALLLSDAAIVATECIRAQGKAVGDRALSCYQVDAVGACIMGTGKLIVVRRLELLLFMAVTGGYDAQGNPKAPPATATTTEPDGTATAD